MYGEDTIWQKEFEEMFPFEETEDQLLALGNLIYLNLLDSLIDPQSFALDMRCKVLETRGSLSLQAKTVNPYNSSFDMLTRDLKRLPQSSRFPDRSPVHDSHEPHNPLALTRKIPEFYAPRRACVPMRMQRNPNLTVLEPRSGTGRKHGLKERCGRLPGIW